MKTATLKFDAIKATKEPKEDHVTRCETSFYYCHFCNSSQDQLYNCSTS